MHRRGLVQPALNVVCIEDGNVGKDTFGALRISPGLASWPTPWRDEYEDGTLRVRTPWVHNPLLPVAIRLRLGLGTSAELQEESAGGKKRRPLRYGAAVPATQGNAFASPDRDLGDARSRGKEPS